MNKIFTGLEEVRSVLPLHTALKSSSESKSYIHFGAGNVSQRGSIDAADTTVAIWQSLPLTSKIYIPRMQFPTSFPGDYICVPVWGRGGLTKFQSTDI